MAFLMLSALWIKATCAQQTGCWKYVRMDQTRAKD
jgi:hypothetical protein